MPLTYTFDAVAVGLAERDVTTAQRTSLIFGLRMKFLTIEGCVRSSQLSKLRY